MKRPMVPASYDGSLFPVAAAAFFIRRARPVADHNHPDFGLFRCSPPHRDHGPILATSHGWFE
jgi:hypothetical protein